MGWRIIWIGILMGLVSLGIGYVYWLDDPDGVWQTMVFTTLALAQLGNALAVRSEKQSLFKLGIGTNRPLLWTVLGTLAIQIAIVYWEPAQDLLHTEALSAADLAVVLVVSTGVFWAVEAEKWVRCRTAARRVSKQQDGPTLPSS